MILDEAIKHAEEVAEEKENEGKLLCQSEGESIGCLTCAEEHRQLAEWLKELKQLREQTRWILVNESLPKVNGWYQCIIQVLDIVRTMDLYYKNGKWLDNSIIYMFDKYDIYGYGRTTKNHKLSYEELKPTFDWTENVIAWKPLSEPYKVEGDEV